MPFTLFALNNKNNRPPLIVDIELLLVFSGGMPLIRSEDRQRLAEAASQRNIVYYLRPSFTQEVIANKQFSGTEADLECHLKLSHPILSIPSDMSKISSFIESLKKKYTPKAVADAFFILSPHANEELKGICQKYFSNCHVASYQAGDLDLSALDSIDHILRPSDKIASAAMPPLILLCDIDGTILKTSATKLAYKNNKSAPPQLNMLLIEKIKNISATYPGKVVIQLITARENPARAIEIYDEQVEFDEELKHNRAARLKKYLQNLAGKKPHHESRVHQAVSAQLVGAKVEVRQPVYSCEMVWRVDELYRVYGAFKYKKAIELQTGGHPVVLFDNDKAEINAACKNQVPAVQVFDSPRLGVNDRKVVEMWSNEGSKSVTASPAYA